MNASTRARDLDGIRGWAALSVMLFHLFWEALGTRFPAWRNLVTATLLNGTLDVSLFFALSGEALSLGFWQRREASSLWRMAVKRYPRLTIPIFFSCLITFVLVRFGGTFHHEAATLLENPRWLGRFLTEGPFSFLELIRFSFLSVYGKVSPTSAFNPFLWTMGIELLGSFIVFLLLGWVGHQKKRPVLAFAWIGMALLLADPMLSLFVAGASMGYLRTKGSFTRLQKSRFWQRCSGLGIPGLFLIAGALQITGFGDRIHFAFLAPALLFCLQANAKATKFFESPFSLWLGNLSFPLYLVHFAVIISVFSWGLLELNEFHALSFGTSGAWALVCAALCLFLARILAVTDQITRPVESWTVKVLERLRSPYSPRP